MRYRLFGRNIGKNSSSFGFAWPYGCLVHVPQSSLYLGEDMSPRLKHDSLLLKSTPKRHLDRFIRFAGQVTNVTNTDRQTDRRL